MTWVRQGGAALVLSLLWWGPSSFSFQTPLLENPLHQQDPGTISLRAELRSAKPAEAFRRARRMYLDRELGELLLLLPAEALKPQSPVTRGLAAGGLEVARDLIPYLGDPSEARRSTALRLLLDLGADEALVLGLHHPNPTVRATARQGLVRMGGTCLPRLIEELRVGQQIYREEVLPVLQAMGKLAARALGILLEDDAFFDRVSPILITHGEVGFESILDRWLRLDAKRKQALLQQMSKRPQRSRAFLLAIVRFGSNEHALNAIDVFSLQQDAKSLVEALRLARTTVRSRALSSLIEMGKPAIPDIARALRDNNPQVRRMALESLQNLGPTAYPSLADLLMGGDPSLRLDAVLFLIQAGSPGLEALGKAQARTNGRSLELLYPSLRKRRSRLLPTLVESLQTKQATSIRTTLALLAALEAWDELAATLSIKNPALESPLRETLIAGGRAVVPAILDELARKEPDSQGPGTAVIRALGNEAIPALIEALDHQDRRKMAAIMLARLTQRSRPRR